MGTKSRQLYKVEREFKHWALLLSAPNVIAKWIASLLDKIYLPSLAICKNTMKWLLQITPNTYKYHFYILVAHKLDWIE
jgi:hypothetical protein